MGRGADWRKVTRLWVTLALGIAPFVSARALAAREAPFSVGQSASIPTRVKRGDEVEARYRAYRERLERFHREPGSQLEGSIYCIRAATIAIRCSTTPWSSGR
jgi:hypothetical protein